jgi:dihydrolipoamide dehydrogenase
VFRLNSASAVPQLDFNKPRGVAAGQVQSLRRSKATPSAARRDTSLSEMHGNMKRYDLIAIGTGSAMNIVQAVLQSDPETRIAVIDKDPPGGICLTKGCIPTKILVYPAQVLQSIESARSLGIDVEVRGVDFKKIMSRMHAAVDPEIERIRKGLREANNIDYYPRVASFVGPGRLRVGNTEVTAPTILLCIGSRPRIPPIRNLSSVRTFTSDTILDIEKRPQRLAILGGGYIAAEFGHFFAAMGTRVTIIGRNRRFLPEEEPEVSDLALTELSRRMEIHTGWEVVSVEEGNNRQKRLFARSAHGDERRFEADEILLAAGRASNADLLAPEKGGIETDENGWIHVDDRLETSHKGVWAFGDATGRHMFKHAANFESRIVYYNAFLGQDLRTTGLVVPHAVFTVPEIASVGMTEAEAVAADGEDGVLIGFHRFRDTAKGDAMGIGGDFVKIVVEAERGKILGAHIAGHEASLLIQEIVTLMYSESPTVLPITDGMHIHPALSEVVERAAGNLMPPAVYHARMERGMM